MVNRSCKPSRMSSSSSMTRILPLALGEVWGAVISSCGYGFPCRAGNGQRELHTEGRAAVTPVGNFDRTAMLLNDTVCHGKTESGALARGLGGEEGIVNAVQVLRRDAVAGVRHLHAGAIALGP